MKYRVGDKVRVKEWEELKRVAKKFDKGIWLIPDEEGKRYWAFTEFMQRFCGKVVEIAEVVFANGFLYKIKEDGEGFIWIEEFFEGKVEQSIFSNEVRIYNKALTPEEIFDLYNSYRNSKGKK